MSGKRMKILRQHVLGNLDLRELKKRSKTMQRNAHEAATLLRTAKIMKKDRHQKKQGKPPAVATLSKKRRPKESLVDFRKRRAATHARRRAREQAKHVLA